MVIGDSILLYFCKRKQNLLDKFDVFFHCWNPIHLWPCYAWLANHTAGEMHADLKVWWKLRRDWFKVDHETTGVDPYLRGCRFASSII